jgi:hypothetical protein
MFNGMCVTLIVLPADVRRIHIDQCEPYQVVILSQRRRICAQGDESTAKPDSSFHLALSLDEWDRMTKFSSEGQDPLGHSAPFWGIVGVQVECHRNSARYFVSLISESVFKCYVYAGSSSAELPMRKGNVAGNRQWPPAGAS